MEVPLNYRGPLNQLRNTQDDFQRFLLQKRILSNNIVIEVDQAIRNLYESYVTVTNLQREVELQEALLEAEKAKLRVGKSIAYTVSQIENDLVVVQTQEIRARTNFEKFRAAYLRAVGTLLESHDVFLAENGGY